MDAPLEMTDIMIRKSERTVFVLTKENDN